MVVMAPIGSPHVPAAAGPPVGGSGANGSGGDSARAVAREGRYKWVALSNITLGTLMVFINQSIVLIALPAIFRGIHLTPLTPSNTSYMLWMLMGFMVVLAVLLVTLGRVGDMFGRVRMYTLGFAVFTLFSILLSVTWLQGSPGAIWLIAMRVGQGVGGAMLFANSSAVITDAFPPTSAASAWASTTWRPSPAASSVWCSAGCWPPSNGTSCSCCRCLSGSSARPGPISGWRNAGCAPARRSTGGGTSRSPRGWC